MTPTDTLPPARKCKEAGKTPSKRGLSSRNTTNTKGKPIWKVSGAKARRQHKDTVKAPGGWSVIRAKEILVFLYAKRLDGLHDEEAYQKIFGVLKSCRIFFTSLRNSYYNDLNKGGSDR